MRKFRTQNALFWYFCFKDFKNYSHILNQNTQINQVLIFCEKRKCVNIGPKMPYLDLFGLELKKKLLSYLKSASSKLSHSKIL